jgi:hypothetical protein
LGIVNIVFLLSNQDFSFFDQQTFHCIGITLPMMSPRTPAAPASDGSMRIMASHRRRRHQPHVVKAFISQQFQALLALLMVLVVCIVIEIILVDTVFLGPTGQITSIQLSNRDYFISDMGAIDQGTYLKAPKSPASMMRNTNLQDQYGEDARIVGLDTCKRYRNFLDEGDGASMAVEGLFQRRAPFFVELMRKNCQLPERDEATDIVYNTGVEEHFPLRNFPNVVLPVIFIQDPLPWMTDVCRDRPSVLELESPQRTDCPTLDEAVRVRYQGFNNATTHRSLAHLWNDWYEPWLSHYSGPRLLIRAEDVLLHPEQLVTSVCQCLGGSIRDHFRNKQPWHIDAVPNRIDGYDEDKLQYAMDHLDSDLLSAMRY